MASSTVIRDSASMKIDDGTTSTGAQKTVSVSVGKIDHDNYSDATLMTMVGLIEPILESNYIRVEHTVVSNVEE